MKAIVCSDIHLSHKCPLIRSKEPDWYAVMRRTLGQLRILQAVYECPVIIAGDIFDKWSNPPELLSFAIGELPCKCYAIAGQHDLPNHNHDDIQRSSLYTLVAAGAVKYFDLEDINFLPGRLKVFAYPWGHSIFPVDDRDDDYINIAVAHQYIWKEGYSHPDADKEQHVLKTRKSLQGYDVAFFGDNHNGFNDGRIMNCGTLMRRKADEIHLKPSVGLLMADASIATCYLDCSADVFLDPASVVELVESAVDMSDVVSSLTSLYQDGLNFTEALIRFMDKNGTLQKVREKVMEAVSGSDK